jgi:hypothetical protein
MSWQRLLTTQKLKPHSTSIQELNDLRSVIARDLGDARITALSADRRFATAYNAALQAATMAVHCAGYRTSGMGHHQTTFESVELAMGSQSSKMIAYFDACRRKRNILDYDRAHIATEVEAAEILTQAGQFYAMVEAWISQTYPHLGKP